MGCKMGKFERIKLKDTHFRSFEGSNEDGDIDDGY